MDSVSTLKPGTVLHTGTYRIIRFLSKGGFGCTYLAEHLLLEEQVAIKELFVSEWCNRDESGTISVAVTSKIPMVGRLHRKFIDEAKAQRRMNHPGVVKVSDVFEEKGTAYYVMDYIDGESLKDKMRRLGHGMPESEALGYIRQVANALAYVHSLNRLHLDIKPANIMVNREGRAILIDFGVSKQYDVESGENTSTLLGNTPGYSSPEQKSGEVKRFSPASDIYSLGATLYKLLTNEVIPDTNLRSSGEPIKPLPANISPATSRAIEAAIQLNKTQRPQSIAELLHILNDNSSDFIEIAELSSSIQPKKEIDEVNVKINDNHKPVKIIQKSETTGKILSNDISSEPNKAKESKDSAGHKKKNLNWPVLIISLIIFIPIVYFIGFNWYYMDDDIKSFDSELSNRFVLDDSQNNNPSSISSNSENKSNKHPETPNVNSVKDFVLDKKMGDNGKYGFKNKKDWIIKPQYDDADDFIDKYAAVKMNGKWGYIDRQGDIVINPKYDKCYSFSHGFAAIGENGKWGYLNEHFQTVIPTIYDWIDPRYSGDPILVSQHEKWGLIDISGNIITPIDYDYIGNYIDDIAMINQKNKWGFIDRNGNKAIPLIYDKVDIFTNGKARVKLNGKEFFIDKNGNRLSD